MDLSQKSTVRIIGVLLLLSAITQTAFTLLYSNPDLRPILPKFWGAEGMLFVFLTGLAGAAMVQSKKYAFVFSAIAFSALLNIIQVGIGFTQFGPAGQSAELLGAYAGGVYNFSFFCYNAAKVLLALAVIDLGLSNFRNGGKILGSFALLAGIIAFALNTYAVILGREVVILARAAGFSGVVATLFLALCIFGLNSDD